MRERDSRASGLAVTAAVFATIASLVVAGVIAAFLVLHVTGSPEQAATTFLTNWETRTYSLMDPVTVNAPEGGVAGPLNATSAQLGMRHLHLAVGQVTQDGSTAQVRFTAAAAQKLGVPDQAGDPIGQGGVQEAYQQQLAGKPAVTIRIQGPGSSRAVAHLPGGPGTPVKTSIVMHDQLAASAAVRAATTTRPVDLVALQPSTGRMLAVIERPGGFDRALQGVFPPRPTFKVVTASALSG